MNSFLNVRTLFASCLVAFSFMLGMSDSANAGNYRPSHAAPTYVKAVRYVKVVTYKYVKQPATRWITVTDKYGCRKRVKITVYRTVKVPVVRWVKVYG